MPELTLCIKYYDGSQIEKKVNVDSYKLGVTAMRSILADLIINEEKILDSATSINLIGNPEDDETMSFPLNAE